MSSIVTKAKSLINVLDTNEAILIKNEDDKKKLSTGGVSVYQLASEEVSGVKRESLTQQAATDLIPANSVDNASDWDHPIVDAYRLQRGFDGDTSVAGEVPCACSKAVLSAEGVMLREGTVEHVQSHVEFGITTGVGSGSLSDPLVVRETGNSFAKREASKGYDPETTRNTKTINATGVVATSPYDPVDPADPDMLNKLGHIARGLAYTAANESFYDNINSLSDQDKMNALIVTTRNGNSSYLDRLASDTFISKMHLDMSNKEDKRRHMDLMTMFRQNRNQIGVIGNNVLSSTMTIGPSHSRHVYSRNMIWTSERKLKTVKKLVLPDGSQLYLASAYDQSGCVTVPVDISKISPDTKAKIVSYSIALLTASENEARHILGLPNLKVDIKSLESFANMSVPTVAEALKAENFASKAKDIVMESAVAMIDNVYNSYITSIHDKAIDNYNHDNI